MQRQLFATRLDRSKPAGSQLDAAADRAADAILGKMREGAEISPAEMQQLTDLMLCGRTLAGVQS